VSLAGTVFCQSPSNPLSTGQRTSLARYLIAHPSLHWNQTFLSLQKRGSTRMNTKALNHSSTHGRDAGSTSYEMETAN